MAYTSKLIDSNNGISTIYAITPTDKNSINYTALYGREGAQYVYGENPYGDPNNSSITFIGYKDGSNLLFYDSEGNQVQDLTDTDGKKSINNEIEYSSNNSMKRNEMPDNTYTVIYEVTSYNGI